MPKYTIERTLPGAEKLSAKDVRDISTKSSGVLRELAPDIQWVAAAIDPVTADHGA